MKLLITDVSVFFDLFHLKVLDDFFALHAEICITQFVYNEIVIDQQIKEIEIYKRNCSRVID
jgi:hypothetical protein